MPRRKRPAREKPDKMREDTAETAYRVLQEAIGDRPKTPPPGERSDAQKHKGAAKLGRKGGAASGKAQAEALTPEERSERARKAAKKRWAEKENDS